MLKILKFLECQKYYGFLECKKIKICFNRQTYQSEMESSHRWPLSKPAHKRCVARSDCNINFIIVNIRNIVFVNQPKHIFMSKMTGYKNEERF